MPASVPEGSRKRLLIVAHAPSPNTRRMRDAVLDGAGSADFGSVEAIAQSPFDTTPDDVVAAGMVILGTTENLGYMSGALKDFFDRCYYPCLDRTQAMPFAFYIRAGHDGTGTRRAIESITGGLRWRAVQAPVLCRGEWRDDFVDRCRDLGAQMAAGLDAGIY